MTTRDSQGSHIASTEALTERVTNLTGDVAELRRDYQAIRREMATGSDINLLRQQISGIAEKFEGAQAAQRPNWIAFTGVLLTAITASVTIAGIVGSMWKAPLEAALLRHERFVDTASERFAQRKDFEQRDRILDAIPEKYVSAKELDNRSAATNARRDDWQKNAETRMTRIEADADLQTRSIVPRPELAEKWQAVNERFADQQRQIDEGKRFQASLVSAPEYLRNLDERLRAVERPSRTN